MIVISGLSDIDMEQYDEVWCITNNCPNIRPGAKHHPELAPFIGTYVNYRRGNICNQNLLTAYGNDLWSGKYKDEINKLISLSEEGKWIQLVCYCKNPDECHRSILAKYLKTFYDKVVSLDE